VCSLCQKLQDEIEDLDGGEDTYCLCDGSRLENLGLDRCDDRGCERFRCYQFVTEVTVDLRGGQSLGKRDIQPACVYHFIQEMISKQGTGFRDGAAVPLPDDEPLVDPFAPQDRVERKQRDDDADQQVRFYFADDDY
jgi:hypothetical protein